MRKTLWDTIPQEVRQKLKKEYKLKPTKSVHVVDNRIIDDGLDEKDLEVIPLEILEDLASIRVEIKNEIVKNEETVKSREDIVEVEASEEIQKGDVVEINNEGKAKAIKPFCDQCDSKGVRHKKECPKNKQNEKTENNNHEQTAQVSV